MERYGAKLCHITPTRYRSNPAAFHEELFAAVRARQAQGLADPRELRLVPRGPLLGGPRRANPPYRVSVALPGAEDAAA